MHILWLKTELLHPVDKGGKIRTYGMLRELKKNHRITYLTLDAGAPPEAVEAADEYCDELIRIPHDLPEKFTLAFYLDLLKNLACPLPYALRIYRSSAMNDAIKARLSNSDIDILVCDFLFPSLNVPSRSDVPFILFQHNVEAKIWERHWRVERNPIKKMFLALEFWKMGHAERKQCRRYDAVVAVSEDDRHHLEARYQLPRVRDVPTGVDVEFFRSTGDIEADPHEVVFTGSMDWLPNQDAIEFFIEDVLPDVRSRVPDVHLTVVGRNPPAALAERADRDPHFSVTGFVDDVRPYVEKASLFVVPIRIGGGTRLKIYEAMAMETPVVSTTVGAEGLPLQPDHHLLIADRARDFADAVVRMLRKPADARALGRRGAALVRDRFGWDSVAERFAEICAEVASTRTRDAAEGDVHHTAEVPDHG